MNPIAHQLATNQHSQVAYLHAKTLLEQDVPAITTPQCKTSAKMQSNEKIAKKQAKPSADAVKKAPWHQRLARAFAPSNDEEKSPKAVQMVMSQSLLNSRSLAMGRC